MGINGECLNQIPDEEFEEYWFNRLPGDRAQSVEAQCAACASCRKRWRKARAEMDWPRSVLAIWELRTGERRSQPRHPAKDWVSIEFAHASSGVHKVYIRLVDESRGDWGRGAVKASNPGSGWHCIDTGSSCGV
jgi:hypothetical protein